MAQKTQAAYKRQTFAGSVAAGLGSIFKAGGKKYYIWEHKITSKYHKAGEWQEIIVDNIELGRSSKCQVQFDESFATVSARHAAIIKEGDNWKLVQLSQTNSTLLNGHKVEKEWYLQNGDEIQLSVNGPKLGFIIPTGAKSTVGTIGLTRRLSLFRQQALRPYKTAITTLCAVLMLAIAAFSYKIYHDNQKHQEQLASMEEKRVQDSIAYAKALAKAEQLRKEAEEAYKKEMDNLNSQIAAQESQRKRDQAVIYSLKNQMATMAGPTSEELKPFLKDVLFLHVKEIKVNGKTLKTSKGQVYGWIGTAYLCDDGRVVTAKHCVEGWLFSPGEMMAELDEDSQDLFYEAITGNAAFETVMTLENANVTYTTSNNAFTTGATTWFQPKKGPKVMECNDFGQDWAISKHPIGQKGNIKRATNSSIGALKAGQKIVILGFPLGVGGADRRNTTPIQSSCTVAHSGTVGGIIEVSDNGFDSGNSGGPAFSIVNGKVESVGIVSYQNGSKGKIGGLVSVTQLR